MLRRVKLDTRYAGIISLGIIDWQDNAGCAFILIRDGLAQIGGKRGNAALARQVIPDEGNTLDDRMGVLFHRISPSKQHPVW
jgi:hypothetical protein